MAVSAPYIGRKGSVEIDEDVFGEPFHMALVHEAARAELAARRRGTASTLTRAEVAMTGAKAWRQKGTGRARAGALSAPQRYGGGVAFGPKPRRHTVKVNRKARRRALRCALSVHAARESLAILDASDFDTPSTRRAREALAADRTAGTLVVVAREGEDGAARSFRNLEGVTVRGVDAVGVADVVGARWLVLSTAALERVAELARPPARRGDGAGTATEVAA
ncbi:MAG TPA: 50S ribosomal protein L4 [Thermoleophilaceae bacterium]|nr:50S ribosomal protein L4 [Thermoleophilaceae bacterium]